MKRALLAIAAVGVMVALLVPLVATAQKKPKPPKPVPGPNPDLTISADPNFVPFGKTTTISGRLRGADNGGKTIEVSENPFPFRDNDRFRKVGDATTDANGDYSFTVTPELNTNYRATATNVDPEEVSNAVFVRVKMRITRSVDDRTPERGQAVTFSGKVTPKHDGLQVLIQRRRPTGTWRTLQTAVLEKGPAGEDSSAYSTEITIKRDGVWRARIKRDEHHLGNRSRRIRLNVP